MKKLLALLVVCAWSTTWAQTEVKKITTAQVGEHVGEKVTVCGVVADARYLENSTSKPTFLNFDKPFPNHTFTAVILPSARANFSEPPEKSLKGKNVCVTGTVKINKSRPEIEVTDASQVTVEAAEAPAAPAAPAATTP